MLEKFLSHIRSENLLSKSEKLLVAVSGGIDSVVLCDLLFKCGFSFSIAHCNFKLRDDESEGDEKFVQRLGKRYDVKVFVNSFNTKKVAKEKKLSVQMAARELRYSWFETLIHEHNFDRLLTAHHLNDNLETFLLNFTRGTGLKGLKGIPSVSGKIVRPLLIFGRNEIEKYAGENKVKFREDSSNRDEKYARNLLRKKVIPVLKQLNPSLENTFLKNNAVINESFEILNEFSAQKKKLLLTKKNNHFFIDIKKLEKEKHKSFFMHEILSPFGFNAEQSSEVIKMIDSLAGKKIASEKYRLTRDRDFFIIAEKKDVDKNEIKIGGFPCSVSGDTSIRFTIKTNKDFVFPQNKKTACFDLEMFKGKTILRKWQEGDRFHPFGMKGTKKLSDFFTSQKMNLFEKENIFILESNGKIAWIVGKRIDDRFAITEKTKKILIAEVIEPS